MAFVTVDWPSALVGAGALALTWTLRDIFYEKSQSAEVGGTAAGNGAARVAPGPKEETGGGPTTSWGRINEKPLTGATVKDDTAFLLHSVSVLVALTCFFNRLVDDLT
jgi:hypothetical protein